MRLRHALPLVACLPACGSRPGETRVHPLLPACCADRPQDDLMGPYAETGCPGPVGPCTEADHDGDGLTNGLDPCRLQSEDPDGFEDTDGCPDPDNDSDGFPDTEDRCPDEPETINAIRDDDGCPD